VVGRGEGSIAQAALSGVVTGLGVALMHYTGWRR
jgi:NO-binding membrane sensor protein with MHYT domain